MVSTTVCKASEDAAVEGTLSEESGNASDGATATVCDSVEGSWLNALSLQAVSNRVHIKNSNEIFLRIK